MTKIPRVTEKTVELRLRLTQTEARKLELLAFDLGLTKTRTARHLIFKALSEVVIQRRNSALGVKEKQNKTL